MRLRKRLKKAKQRMSVLNCLARPSFLADITVFAERPCADGVRLPNGTYTIAALPIIGILLVIGGLVCANALLKFTALRQSSRK